MPLRRFGGPAAAERSSSPPVTVMRTSRFVAWVHLRSAPTCSEAPLPVGPLGSVSQAVNVQSRACAVTCAPGLTAAVLGRDVDTSATTAPTRTIQRACTPIYDSLSEPSGARRGEPDRRDLGTDRTSAPG